MTRQLNDERRFWKYLIFGILTAGIYDLYMWWTMIDDINEACDYVDEEPRSPHFLVTLLLSFITFGIYYFVWLYKQGDRIQDAGHKYGIRIKEKGTEYLLWSLLGGIAAGLGSWIAIYMLINNCNRLCKAYNEQVAGSVEVEIKKERKIPKKEKEALPAPKEEDNISKTVFTVNGTLEFISGEYQGAEIPIEENQELVLGRNPNECQIILTAQDISRKHCSIRFSRAEGCYYITDYSSLGTIMNDTVRLKKGAETRCSSRTKISLGEGGNVFVLK